jgi:hypothetical protein
MEDHCKYLPSAQLYDLCITGSLLAGTKKICSSIAVKILDLPE